MVLVREQPEERVLHDPVRLAQLSLKLVGPQRHRAEAVEIKCYAPLYTQRARERASRSRSDMRTQRHPQREVIALLRCREHGYLGLRSRVPSIKPQLEAGIQIRGAVRGNNE